MMLVDSQVHTWTRGTPPPVHRQSPFTNAALLAQMNAAGVQRAVLVPPGWDATAMAHALEGARCHPDRFVVMGRMALDGSPDRALLAGWKRPGLLGLRLALSGPAVCARLEHGEFDWIWEDAERHDIPIMLAVWGRLDLALPVAQRHPGLRLAIDHLGIAVTHRTVDDAAFADMDALLALCRLPNVAAKASGLPAHSTQAYPYANLHGHLRRVFDAVGPSRLFWGTDLTRMPVGYGPCIRMFTEALPWLAPADQRLVMGEALCRWIGWDLPEDARCA